MAQMHNPAHPGEVLREFLPKDLPVGEIASRLEFRARPCRRS